MKMFFNHFNIDYDILKKISTRRKEKCLGK